MLKDQEEISFSRWKSAFNHVYLMVYVSSDSKIFGLPLLEHSFFGQNDCSLIVSGNLNQWREAIVAGLQKRNKDVRVLAGHCYLLFELESMGHLFLAYEKVANADGTFYLRAKDGS